MASVCASFSAIAAVAISPPSSQKSVPVVRTKASFLTEKKIRSVRKYKKMAAAPTVSVSVAADPSLPEKIVVVVDVDEVLGHFLPALNRFIADRYSEDYSVSDYLVYEFCRIWNCSPDEGIIDRLVAFASNRVREFYETAFFKEGIHPLPGAQKSLENLSTLCKLSVVTSRQDVIKNHTIEWLQKHYPGVFHEVHFGNHFARDGQSTPKSELCRLIGAKVLIDDNPRYAAECAQAGMRVLLFDYEKSYPWSKAELIDEHALVTKVCNWEEVEQQIATLGV